MIETNHPIGRIDRYLRTLGVKDRVSWEVEANDDHEYRGARIAVRPDWVLKNVDTGERIIVSYKSRSIGVDQHPSDYEAIQVCIEGIEGIVVKRYLEVKHNYSHSIGLVVLYGNNQKRAIYYDNEDNSVITKTAAAWCSKHRTSIPRSKLAKILALANFKDVPDSRRQKGTAEHESMRDLGRR